MQHTEFVKKPSCVQMNNKNVRNQKDLAIIASDTLNWNENAKRRHSKALRALWSLKRNLSLFTRMKSRLNAYIGYIVPIIMFGYQVWYPSKTDLRLIEKLQKEATKWICWSESDYIKQLAETKLSPLSLYAALQSLLLHCSIIDRR